MKYFTKFIFLAVFLVGVFAVGSGAKAIDCCLMEKGVDSGSLQAKSCRLKDSSACNTTLVDICSVGLGSPLGMLYQGTWGQISCRTGATAEERYYKETQINCTAHALCKQVAAQELTKCGDLSETDCPLQSACFWSVNRNQCLSRYDGSICSTLNATDCGYMGDSGTCKWVDGQCMDAFAQSVRTEYKTTSNFLPSCAAAGQCRKLSDIFYPILKIVDEIFKYVGVLAFIFFVIGGFTMILSFGNSEKFKKGQQILVAAVIGMLIVFGAYLMVSFLLEALGTSSEFNVLK